MKCAEDYTALSSEWVKAIKQHANEHERIEQGRYIPLYHNALKYWRAYSENKHEMTASEAEHFATFLAILERLEPLELKYLYQAYYASTTVYKRKKIIGYGIFWKYTVKRKPLKEIARELNVRLPIFRRELFQIEKKLTFILYDLMTGKEGEK